MNVSGSEPVPGRPGLFSIGHSNHRFEVLLALLQRHLIEVVADVRSAPYSRYNPQYNARDRRLGLVEAGIRYVFLGKELGGRPEGDRFYDSDGHILYGRMAETDWFRLGLDRLCDGASRYRTAILCSEEDPVGCHRYLLITRALSHRGVTVTHIRGDGALQSPEEMPAFDSEYRESSLFGGEGRSSWRSTRPASPRGRPKTSSKP